MIDRRPEEKSATAPTGWSRPLLIAGVGSEAAGDDAAGLLVARRLAGALAGVDGICVLETSDPSGLINQWQGFAMAVIVDSMRSGRPAGTCTAWDHGALPGPSDCHFTSTHGIGVLDAVSIARQLDSLPGRLVVFGIEAGTIRGEEISQAVACAIEEVVAELLHNLRD